MSPIQIQIPQSEILIRPFAGLLCFLNLAFDDLALQRRHAIEKYDSVAVIRFVQHAARRKFGSVKLKLFAVGVMRANYGSQISFDTEEDSGEGKTAFVAVLLALLRDDFRID